jgi:hypothetical protein
LPFRALIKRLAVKSVIPDVGGACACILAVCVSRRWRYTMSSNRRRTTSRTSGPAREKLKNGRALKPAVRAMAAA